MPCVFLATLAGALVGLIDALDLVLEGNWTAQLSGAEVFGVVAVTTVTTAAAGTVLGLGWAGLTLLARRMGLAWERGRGLSFRQRVWLSPRYLVAVVAVTVAGWSCYALWFKHTFGVERWQIVALVIPGLTGISALGGRRSRVSVALAWMGVVGWAMFTEMRVIYGSSRYGGALIYHAISAIGLVVLVSLAVWFGILGRRERPSVLVQRSRRLAVLVLAVLSLGVLGFVRPALESTSNDFRLALYERTTIAYRLFSVLPFERPDLGGLASVGRCEEPMVTGPSAAATVDHAGDGEPVRGVVLVMIDTLRYDFAPHRLYQGRPLTPAIDALAESGTSFTAAYTTVPATKHAVRSILSGVMPVPLDAEPDESTWLVANLDEAGVRTIALIDHPHLEESVTAFDEVIELTPDFRHDEINSQRVFETTRDRLDRLGADERFFMFVHFYDPHAGYERRPDFDLGPTLEDAYASEVAYTDHWTGRLVDHLAELGIDDEVAIMIVSDHGEELWEHRYRWHGVRLYDESARVPLILRVPGAPAGLEVISPVSLVDVVPTVLDLFDVAAPEGLEGVSLLPVSLGRPGGLDGRAVFMASRQYPTYAAVRDGRKVIINRDTGVIEAYDLESDPGEHNNLADAPTPELQGLYCELVAWMGERVAVE